MKSNFRKPCVRCGVLVALFSYILVPSKKPEIGNTARCISCHLFSVVFTVYYQILLPKSIPSHSETFLLLSVQPSFKRWIIPVQTVKALFCSW